MGPGEWNLGQQSFHGAYTAGLMPNMGFGAYWARAPLAPGKEFHG